MIIDQKILVHGSMNLGQKSLNNFEHIQITEDSEMIKQFTKRFDKMWKTRLHFTEFIPEPVTAPALPSHCDNLSDYQL